MIEYYQNKKINVITYRRGNRGTVFTKQELFYAVLRDASHDITYSILTLLKHTDLVKNFKKTYQLLNLLLEIAAIAHGYGEKIFNEDYFFIKARKHLYTEEISLASLSEKINILVNQVYIPIIKKDANYASLFSLDEKIYNYLKARFFNKKKLKIIFPYNREEILQELIFYSLRISKEILSLYDNNIIKEGIETYIDAAANIYQIYILYYWDLKTYASEEFIKGADIIRNRILNLAKQYDIIKYPISYLR